MTAQQPDPYDPQLAKRNKRLGLVLLAVILGVMFLSYLMRHQLFLVLFKVQ